MLALFINLLQYLLEIGYFIILIRVIYYTKISISKINSSNIIYYFKTTICVDLNVSMAPGTNFIAWMHIMLLLLLKLLGT